MISVVIPCYNMQEYLPDCLESVIGQTSEIIVVNDGSTDKSLEIAQKYPVKVIHQVNKGLSSARNTGIMNATGEYILFLDADDMLMENCIEVMEKYIKDSSPDILSASFKCFGVDNNEVILMENPTLEDFKVGNRIGSCSCVKKSALLEVGGYSPRMVHGYEDLHLWIDLLKRGKKIVTIPEVLWMYRTKEHSMIHDALAHHDELMVQIYKDHPEFV